MGDKMKTDALENILKLVDEIIIGEELIANDDRYSERFRVGVNHSLVMIKEIKQKIQLCIIEEGESSAKEKGK